MDLTDPSVLSSVQGSTIAIRNSGEPVPTAAPPPPPPPPPTTPLFPELSLSTQISQSLDRVDGHYYQLFGGSSEADPWLLRHCRYDELGFRKFLKVHFRNAGGVPTREKIPAHFMVSEDQMSEATRSEIRFGGDGDLRTELAFYVPTEQGLRLIRL